MVVHKQPEEGACELTCAHRPPRTHFRSEALPPPQPHDRTEVDSTTTTSEAVNIHHRPTRRPYEAQGGTDAPMDRGRQQGEHPNPRHPLAPHPMNCQ